MFVTGVPNEIQVDADQIHPFDLRKKKHRTGESPCRSPTMRDCGNRNFMGRCPGETRIILVGTTVCNKWFNKWFNK